MNKGKKSPSQLSALDRAVDAAMAGTSYRVVEALTGVPRSTVRYHVNQRGIARRSVPRSGPRLRAHADVEIALQAVAAGVSWRRAAEAGGVGISTLYRHLRGESSVMPGERKRRDGILTVAEREEIRVGIELGESDNRIAERIGRHRSTVWREIQANGGRRVYSAAAAELRATQAARRPKPGWTDTRSWLWDQVCQMIRTKKWSPEHICWPPPRRRS